MTAPIRPTPSEHCSGPDAVFVAIGLTVYSIRSKRTGRPRRGHPRLPRDRPPPTDFGATGRVNDPYAMPNGVLRNKLGITDHQQLAAAEADLTRARLIMLTERPLPGAYDLGHLRAFHAAGEVFGRLASSG